MSYSKYGNIKSIFRGRKYDSRSEAKYAKILFELLDKGKIKAIKQQVRFPLQDLRGTKRMAYIADFIVTNNQGEDFIIDVKGLLTNESKVKLAYFQYVYKKIVHLVYTTGPEAFTTRFLKI